MGNLKFISSITSGGIARNSQPHYIMSFWPPTRMGRPFNVQSAEMWVPQQEEFAKPYNLGPDNMQGPPNGPWYLGLWSF